MITGLVMLLMSFGRNKPSAMMFHVLSTWSHVYENCTIYFATVFVFAWGSLHLGDD